MKSKFIRVLSPITVFVIALLDASIIALGIYAVKRISEDVNKISISFVIIEVLAIIIGIFVTKDIFTYGVKFFDDKMEFTAIDNNNVFEYCNIEKIESNRDTKASLKKNFVDRYTSIIIYQKDGSVTTVELGLTTDRAMKKVIKEIESRLNND